MVTSSVHEVTHLGQIIGQAPASVHGGAIVNYFVLLLPFHPPVLEPDLDLPFRQAQGVGDLYPSPPGQVAVEVELLFQLQRLVASVCLSSPFTFRSELRLHPGVDGDVGR